MKKLLMFAGIVLLVTSCVGIKSTVSFNRDGSGVIQFEYRISKMITELSSQSADKKAEAPLPISEEELRGALANHPDLKLKKVTQREDERDVYITAEIEFAKIDEFTSVKSFNAMPMSLEKKGNEYIFRQYISKGESGGEGKEGENAEPDEATKQMMASFFEGYELSFTVNSPSAITYNNLGEVSPDKKSLSYSIPLLELNSLKQETVLEVRWKT